MEWGEARGNGAARILVGINAVAIAVSISGQGVFQALQMRPQTWMYGLVIAILATIQLALWRAISGRRLHKLDELTPAFSSFFSKWYAQDGRHVIFCSDLEWLEHQEHDVIRRTLLARPGRYTVLLRDDSGLVADELKSVGVPVIRIPPRIRTSVRMSLHVRDDDETMIIRRKLNGGNQGQRIVFVETDEKHMITLAKDVINSCLPNPIV